METDSCSEPVENAAPTETTGSPAEKNTDVSVDELTGVLPEAPENTESDAPDQSKGPEEGDPTNTSTTQAADEFADDADEDADEDDDAVNIIIKPPNKGSVYKTGVTYQSRSQALNPQLQKPVRQGVNLADPGNIQGVPTIDFNLTTLGEEEKPWKRPGADITDYFNYGFTEETWTQYCEKQKILRQEYTNSALKPVVVGAAAGLGFSGLTLAQRNRFVGLPVRPFDAYKPAANMNVINLSSSQRTTTAGGGVSNNTVNRLPLADNEGSEAGTKSPSRAAESHPGGVFNGGPLVSSFSIPPPDFPTDQSTATLNQLNTAVAAAGAFNFPPPAFGAAGTAGVFPNTAVPPPVLNANLFAQQQHQANPTGWPGGGVGSGLISLLSGPAMRPTGSSGRGPSDNRGPTPEDLFSDEEYSESRRRRYPGDDETDDRYADRYDRDQYRSSRRSRSRSRDRRYSGRSRRYHDESSSRDRDYGRHGERSRRRSREHHHSRSDRHQLAGNADVDASSDSRRSRERSPGHRESRRDQRRSDRESRAPTSAVPASSSSSRSSRRHGGSSRSGVDQRLDTDRRSSQRSRSRSPPLNRRQASVSPDDQPKQPATVMDPLAAAAAAAADIAARINRDEGQVF
ncbi:hypothetical protein SprV_0100043800 [Sparganum proliferum]